MRGELGIGIMLKFREYKSFEFKDRSDPSSLVGVKDGVKDPKLLPGEITDGRWVYHFHTTIYTPHDGIPVRVWKCQPEPGKSYHIPRNEGNSANHCWSFFCLSKIELDPKRLDVLRRQVSQIVDVNSVPSGEPWVNYGSCPRLMWAPLTRHQFDLKSASRIGQMYTPGDVAWEEDGQSATVYLTDYVEAIKKATKDYEEGKKAFFSFSSTLDGNPPFQAWKVSRGQSYSFANLVGSICKQDEKYNNDLNYSDWKAWFIESSKRHQKSMSPMNSAILKVCYFLQSPAFNATLFDYAFSQSKKEREFPEKLISETLAKTNDSPATVNTLTSLIDQAHDISQVTIQTLGESFELKDAINSGGEENWWTMYVGGWKDFYEKAVNPVTENTTKILQCIATSLAATKDPLIIWNDILDRRYTRSASRVVFKPGNSFILRGKRCTSEDAFRDMIIKRYSKKYGNIKIAKDGEYYVAQYESKRYEPGERTETFGEGLECAMNLFDLVYNLNSLLDAKSPVESVKVSLGLATDLVYIYSKFIKPNLRNFREIQYLKAFPFLVSFVLSAIDFAQDGEKYWVAYRTGNYDDTLASQIAQSSDLLSMSSSLAFGYFAQQALEAGAVGSNIVPLEGQVAAVILGVLALFTTLGLWVWNSYFRKKDLEIWLEYFTPWGTNFGRLIPQDKSWEVEVFCTVTPNDHPYPDLQHLPVIANYASANIALVQIKYDFLLEAGYRDVFSHVNGNPSTLLQLTVKLGEILQTSSPKKMTIGVEIHNGYHYFPLDTQEIDLLNEVNCNRGIDPDTGQTLYFVNWYDSDIRDLEYQIGIFCDLNYRYFDHIWKYSEIAKDDERRKAIQQLQDTVKNDGNGILNLAKAILLMSRLEKEWDGSLTCSSDKLFLRVCAWVEDSTGRTTSQVVDVQGNIFTLEPSPDDSTLQMCLEYTKSTQGKIELMPKVLPFIDF